MFTPSVRGVCKNGLANVLSHIVRMLRCLHVAVSLSKSQRRSRGFEGVSIISNLVFGRSALSTC